MKRRPALVWLLPLLVVAAILPRVVPGSFALTLLVFISLYSMVTLGLQLVLGYAGQISIGQGAFMGIGAYGYAILAVKQHVPAWPALIAAALINVAIAYIIGKPILRLSGHQLALATLAFGIIVATILAQATGLTGGAIGISAIPNLAVGGFAFNDDMRNAYLAEGFAIASLLLAHNMMRSRIGRALQALNASPPAAESLGVDVAGHKLHIFAFSALLASLAGSLYAAYLTYISPDAFSIFLSVEILVMASVGGMATVWGAPIGAAAIFLLHDALDNISKGLPSGTVSILQTVIFGAVLIAIMIFVPEGLTRGVIKGVEGLRSSTPL
ncbi:MAG TPA: branched-chain amino acid ABC transporter permease [Chloroflexota bacterium]|nr:branched-chain amino acid ABC transporter permease [Chloroflexota bacterium]